MKINHLIIGCSNVELAVSFYSEIFGYKFAESFTDTGTGGLGKILAKGNSPSVLLVPFSKERLPNPQHIAFEFQPEEFEAILNRCLKNKIEIRGGPALNSAVHEVTTHQEQGQSYKHFYICDPSKTNLEIMAKI